MKKTSAISAMLFLGLGGCNSEMHSLSSEQATYLSNNIRATSRGSFTTQEDTSLIARVSKYGDPDKRIKFRVVRLPTMGKINHFNSLTADFEYMPNTNATGTDSFEFVANVDSAYDSAPHLVEIKIQPVNDAPTADTQIITFNEDVALSGAVSGKDAEGKPLTFQISRQPTKGSIALNTNGNFMYAPFANANGVDTFTFTAKDEELTSPPATVTLNITPVNDLPVALNGNLNTNEDSSTSGKLTAQDADGDALIYELVSMPVKGTLNFNSSTGNYTYTPQINANGTDSFTFRVRDNVGASNVATVSIDLMNINDVPVAQNLNLTTNEDVSIAAKLSATDIDGDLLTYRIFANPTKGSIQGFNTATGNFIYVPNQNFNGVDTFQFVARDGSFDSQVKTVTIDVAPVNDPPYADSLSVALDQDTSYLGTFLGTDGDGDFLTYATVTQPLNGTVSVSGNKFTYTPNAGFSGADNFTFRANDSIADSAIAVVSIVIHPVTPPPPPEPMPTEPPP